MHCGTVFTCVLGDNTVVESLRTRTAQTVSDRMEYKKECPLRSSKNSLRNNIVIYQDEIMSCQEQQEEEVEVLQSIYEGDDCFQGVNATTYQYKLGEDGGPHSFVLEVVWGENYPEEVPTINLDCFYNKHILPTIKDEIVQKVKEEAEQNLGCAMTYTLFEWIKENAESLMADQPLAPVQVVEEAAPKETQVKAVKVKKEQLTKAQKRKITNQTNIRGERQRGWDWVDVIRHLSQTGKYTGDDT